MTIEGTTNSLETAVSDNAAVTSDISKTYAEPKRGQLIAAQTQAHIANVTGLATRLWGNRIETSGDEIPRGFYTLDKNGEAWRELASVEQRLTQVRQRAERADLSPMAESRARALVRDAIDGVGDTSIVRSAEHVVLDRLTGAYQSALPEVQVAMQDLGGAFLSGEGDAVRHFREFLARQRDARVNTPDVRQAMAAYEQVQAQLARAVSVTRQAAGSVRGINDASAYFFWLLGGLGSPALIAFGRDGIKPRITRGYSGYPRQVAQPV